MAVRQQEAVAAFPMGIFGAQVHGVAVSHGEHIGVAQRLSDVALALYFAHAQGIAANTVCVAQQRVMHGRGRVLRFQSCLLDG